MRTRFPFAVCLSVSLVLAGGLLAAQPAPQPAGGVYAAYVLLAESPGGSTVAFARAIVDPGQSCPALLGAGAERIAMAPRRNPHGFAVKVCEARYPFGRSLTVEGGPQLPAVTEAPSRIAMLGDSGCKPKDQAGCGLDDPQWPLPVLARAAAASRPDLVLHVGDYNYRGTPSGFKTKVDGQEVQQWYYDAGDGATPAEKCGIPGPYRRCSWWATAASPRTPDRRPAPSPSRWTARRLRASRSSNSATWSWCGTAAVRGTDR